jgi:mannose-6-phosphate isomerase-like protein (cupin superfamily)
LSAGQAESRKVRLKDGGLEGLEQTVLECAPGTCTTRATGDAEEALFVVAGEGEIRLGDERHALTPETGISVGAAQEYELRNESSDPLRIVCVRIRGAAPQGGGAARREGGTSPERGAVEDWEATAASPNGAGRVVVRRLAEQEAHEATTDRSFRIVADPSTGLRGATQFVGYVPTVRAPDHFHTYDEVIYVLDGEGMFHAGGTSRPISPGSCIELPARTVHCLENTGPEVMRLVAVFRPPGSPAAAYYPDGTPAYPGTPALTK